MRILLVEDEPQAAKMLAKGLREETYAVDLVNNGKSAVYQAAIAGLGLPIARWIAEAHGGTLVLESSGPSGSCFTISLPSA